MDFFRTVLTITIIWATSLKAMSSKTHFCWGGKHIHISEMDPLLSFKAHCPDIMWPPPPPNPEQFLMSLVTWTKKYFILLSRLWQKCTDRAKKEEDKAIHYFKHVIPLLFSAAGGLFKAEIISHCKKKKGKKKWPSGIIITIRSPVTVMQQGEAREKVR